MIPGRCYIRIFSLSLIILVTILPISEHAICESDFENATTMIEIAKDALGSAYLSCLEVEKEGADASVLVTRLNVVLDYYNRAEEAYKSGEYGVTILITEDIIEASEVILVDGILLKHSAVQQRKDVFWNKLIMSFITAGLIIVVSLVGWRVFKEYYVRRLMIERPEVINNESK